MSYNTNPVTGNNTMYIDEQLTTQNQNISYNISNGNNNAGFQTPSTNYLPYTINEDGSISYIEQGKTIIVSCSESDVANLYEIIQPYTYTNSINNGFSGYALNDYINKDAQHTTYSQTELQNYYGVWFQYDFSQLTGAFRPNKIIVNGSGISGLVVLGSNDLTNWYDSYFFTTDYKTLTKTGGLTYYNYYRLIVIYASNNSDFTLSSIQFIDDLFLSSSNFGTCSSNVLLGVTLGSFDTPLHLRYTTVERNINGLGTGAAGADFLLDTDLDNTYPPTSTATNKSITTNVATQLYNAIPGTSVFYLAYRLPYSQTLTANTWSKFFNFTSEAQLLTPGLSLASVLSSGVITIPYAGLYQITMSVHTTNSTVIDTDIYVFSSSYWGNGLQLYRTTRPNSGYNTTHYVTHTCYFTQGDQIQPELMTSTTTSTNSGATSVGYKTKASIMLLQRTA